MNLLKINEFADKGWDGESREMYIDCEVRINGEVYTIISDCTETGNFSYEKGDYMHPPMAELTRSEYLLSETYIQNQDGEEVEGIRVADYEENLIDIFKKQPAS